MAVRKIECSGCHHVYKVDESKIPNRAVRSKCKKCGNIIIINEHLLASKENEIADQKKESLAKQRMKNLQEKKKRRAEEKRKKGDKLRQIIKAKGVNGQIELHPNKVCIKRKGVMSFLTQGLKGDKNIMISSITSVQFKEAGVVTNGYIQFGFMGGQESKGGIFQGALDENTVMFTVDQQPKFERIRNKVEKSIYAGAKTAQISTSSEADELSKFAELRDKGVLTEEEFQKKKKQILGL